MVASELGAARRSVVETRAAGRSVIERRGLKSHRARRYTNRRGRCRLVMYCKIGYGIDIFVQFLQQSIEEADEVSATNEEVRDVEGGEGCWRTG